MFLRLRVFAVNFPAFLMRLTEADLARILLGPVMVVSIIIIFRKGKNKAGRLLKVIGILHMIAGGWVARAILWRVWREGIFGKADSGLGTVRSDIPKEMVFWFLMWGPFAFILGMLVSWFESRGKYPPASVGWTLGAVSLIAAALDPKGGFWWVLVPAFLIIRGPHARAKN